MVYSLTLFISWLLLVQDTSIHSLIVGAIIVLVVRVAVYYFNITASIINSIWPFNWRIILYIPWLLKEIWLSAISVVKIIWNPKMTINPALEVITTIQQTDVARVLYANSINLTPGTYTVNLGQDNLLVHSLVKQDVWSLEMEKRISKVVKC